MQDTYDVVESVFAAKADERMIAFAGFQMPLEDRATLLDGVLKIAAYARNDGSGYLTLTFVLDLEKDQARAEHLSQRFRLTNQETLQRSLGPDFEMLLEIPLNTFAESAEFYVEELHLYFFRLAARERSLIEEYVLPALSQLLGMTFESVQWLPEDPQSMPSGHLAGFSGSHQTLFHKWFDRI